MVQLLLGYENIDIIDSIRETEFPVTVDSHIITCSDSGEVVGVINMEDCGNSIYLQTLEILKTHRYKQYATAAINKIFENNPHIENISGVVFSDIIEFYSKIEGCVLKPCIDPNICSTDDMQLFTIYRI